MDNTSFPVFNQIKFKNYLCFENYNSMMVCVPLEKIEKNLNRGYVELPKLSRQYKTFNFAGTDNQNLVASYFAEIFHWFDPIKIEKLGYSTRDALLRMILEKTFFDNGELLKELTANLKSYS